MAEDAKTEFRVFIEDLAVGTVVGKVLGDEILVDAGLLHQFANLLAAVRTGICSKGAVTVGRELLESISHQLTPLSDIGDRIAEVTHSMLRGNGRQVRGRLFAVMFWAFCALEPAPGSAGLGAGGLDPRGRRTLRAREPRFG
jgi:hypothetical protein